jgi:hypothetical protein
MKSSRLSRIALAVTVLAVFPNIGAAQCCSMPLFSRAGAMGQWRGFFVAPSSNAATGANEPSAQTERTKKAKDSATTSTQSKVSLSPRFSPGQTYRYAMQFETTSAISRSGLASDPQGPSKSQVTWDATIRLEVLAAEAKAPGGIRLRTTYEKSSASISSDTFDPSASATMEQYQKLEGKVVELTLDANGKVSSISGLSEIVNGEQAERQAREWIAQLDASSGAPSGGVTIGQKWFSDQPATSMPVAGMVWRTESQYLRNEECRPPNPDGAPIPKPAESAANPVASETCAVILSNLSLVRLKSVRNSTPDDYRKNGMESSGKWNGSAQSLSYVSLRTGLTVSVTQTGTEDMDITVRTAHNTSMHYAGTVLTRSQVSLLADVNPEK